MILFEDAAKILVLLHAAAAIVLIGSSTHHAIIAFGYLRGRYASRLGRIYAATSFVAYGITFLFGVSAYPAFRYYARALYLDRYAPWASNLFDLKEHFASLGLPLVLGAFLLSRVIDPKNDRAYLPSYAAMVFGVCLITWFNLFSGLIVTLEKGP